MNQFGALTIFASAVYDFEEMLHPMISIKSENTKLATPQVIGPKESIQSSPEVLDEQ